MIYYISDIHFGCTNKYEGRTLDHDQLIKNNWNAVVNNNDDVYILGDIGRVGANADNEKLLEIVATLKGRKHLITGNHDVGGLKDARIKQQFVEIAGYKELQDSFDGKAHKVVLSHYPITMWNGQHKGWIHLYGHVHMTDEYTFYLQTIKNINDFFKDKELKGRTDCPPAVAYNVGVMLPWMDYYPRTLKEIMSYDKSND